MAGAAFPGHGETAILNSLAEIFLRAGQARRLRAGHPWVFSNEVDVGRTPLQALEPGTGVVIREHGGKPLGCGYANPHSLICARLVSRSRLRPLDESMLVERIGRALALRERLYPGPWYRLVHGEADALPGLVIDRFGDTCVVQIGTAGMERVREAVVAALDQVLAPRHVLLRADSAMREMEGLERYVEWAHSDGPEELAIEENGARFRVAATRGQKTGWYYDHRDNRTRLQKLARGCRVLDLYAYTGAWGIEAAIAGASEVVSVDSSGEATGQATRNAQLNDVAAQFQAVQADVVEYLGELRRERRHFDIVIADPPAFIKRRRDYRKGLGTYHRLNQAAMQVLARDGIMVSASCSAHLPEAELVRVLLRAARHVDRGVQIIAQGQQAMDHPVHPAIPETRYIKALFGRVELADDLV